MCSVDSLTIREVSGYTGKQVVDLRGGTNVTGPIVAETVQQAHETDAITGESLSREEGVHYQTFPAR